MNILLKRGSRGVMVKKLQQLLKLYPDGIFGPLTEERVIEFQRENGLTVDGIVGPSTWSRLAGVALLPKSKRVITDIIIHCTATPEGQDYTVEQIRADHKARGFADVGYHYIIYRDGSIHLGRNIDIAGAHCKNHNSHSIGVAYVGGLEYKKGVPYKNLKAKDTRTPEQKTVLLNLLRQLRETYPSARIKGHRDYSPDKNKNGTVEPSEWIKSCPSFDIAKELSLL